MLNALYLTIQQFYCNSFNLIAYSFKYNTLRCYHFEEYDLNWGGGGGGFKSYSEYPVLHY